MMGISSRLMKSSGGELMQYYNAHEITTLEYAAAWIHWCNHKRWKTIYISTTTRIEYCEGLIQKICDQRPDMTRHLVRIKLGMDTERAKAIVLPHGLESRLTAWSRIQSIGRVHRKRRTTAILLSPFGS